MRELDGETLTNGDDHGVADGIEPRDTHAEGSNEDSSTDLSHEDHVD